MDHNADIVPGTFVKDFNVDMQTPMTTVLDIHTSPLKYTFGNSVALDAANYILDMRYVTSMREDEGGTYGAQASVELGIEPKEQAVINIYYNSKPSSADKLRELALKDLKALAENGPTAEEFDMAKKNLQKRIPESRIKNSYWEASIQWYELHGMDSDKEYEAAVEALTPEAIKNVLSEILSANNFIEVIMRPGNAVEKE